MHPHHVHTHDKLHSSHDDDNGIIMLFMFFYLHYSPAVLSPFSLDVFADFLMFEQYIFTVHNNNAPRINL